MNWQWQLKINLNKRKLGLNARFILVKIKKFELDIFLEIKNEKVGIELKYKTKSIYPKNKEKKYQCPKTNEMFDLKTQAAHGNAGYDFIKDISRIEKLQGNKNIDKGFAILLTNDKGLFPDEKPQKGKYPHYSDRYENLYLYQGRQLKGGIGWGRGSIKKLVGKERANNIKLSGNYKLNWEQYSKLMYPTADDKANNDVVKMLIVEIK